MKPIQQLSENILSDDIALLKLCEMDTIEAVSLLLTLAVFDELLFD